ncbi:MAG: LCP family protein [Propionibacteriaceae bacterium]
MGEKEQADLEWLYRCDPETIAKDGERAKKHGQSYEPPSLPVTNNAISAKPSIRPSQPIPPAPPPRRPANPNRVIGSTPLEQKRSLPSKARTTATAKRHSRRRITLITLISLLLILCFSFGYLLTAPLGAWNSITRVDDAPQGNRPSSHPGTAILIVGSDSRSGLTAEDMNELAPGGEIAEGNRTDTMMLLYKPDHGQSVLLSIPRDSWTDIPGQGEAKINAAFTIGGAELLINTIEQRTGFRIDGYAEIGFGGFAGIVKALGGLDICIQEAVEGEGSFPTIQPGCQRLSPRDALWYVRARHNDSEGDIGRTARQRTFMSAVMKQVLSKDVIFNRDTYKAVNKAISDGMTVGDKTGMGDAIAIAKGMKAISAGDGTAMTLPIADPAGWSDDGQSIVVLDDERMRQLFNQLNKGDTSNLEKYR